MNAMLKAEEARNAAMLAQLQSLTASSDQSNPSSPFAFLTSSPHTSTTAQPLSQNTRHAIAQLPALRELLAQLKSSLASLPAARQARLDENSAAAKRRGYIDAQARRALERRGVDVSGLGGGEGAGAGRRVAAEEVQGLESVVQALGGAEGE